MASASVDHEDSSSTLDRLQTFHLFSDLPPELRRQIWKINFPQAQVHFLIRGPCLFNGESKRDIPPLLENIASPPLPVALMINKDSRSIALEHYKRFQKFPSHAYPPEEMPYGYYNPRTDFLHIPNTVCNDDWNFANAPFRNITFCAQRYDSTRSAARTFPESAMRGADYYNISNLTMEVIKLSRQRLSLGFDRPGESFAPNITLVAADMIRNRHRGCKHMWPLDKPHWTMGLTGPDSGKLRLTRRAAKWAAELHKNISGSLDDEKDKERYLPAVEIGLMPLICRCPEVVDSLKESEYGALIRYMDGHAREW